MKRILLLTLLSITMYNCSNNKTTDPFVISHNRIGSLTSQTRVNQLDSIFKNDSVVTLNQKNNFLNTKPKIEIYRNDGTKLLILEPRNTEDPNSTIETIQVIDSIYHTQNGLSSNSIFKDIKDQYSISKINNTLSSAVIFMDSIQSYVTIDKKELPAKFKFNTDIKIEASEIPELAKIKHFWIHWDNN